MFVLATIDASQDGDGGYVIQVRTQYPHETRQSPWQTREHVTGSATGTEAGVYTRALARSHKILEDPYVKAVRVIQVKEHYYQEKSG